MFEILLSRIFFLQYVKERFRLTPNPSPQGEGRNDLDCLNIGVGPIPILIFFRSALRELIQQYFNKERVIQLWWAR